MPENELLKKLNEIKKEVLQPVLGDVTVDPSQILDFTVMKAYSGRSKVGIIFQENGELKIVYIGAIHVNRLEECIKKNKTINIRRKLINGIPQTEISC